MTALTLVIGNRNYSSWSLRAWILLRHLGLEFNVVRLPLQSAEFAREIERYSPSSRVPVLLHGELRVWESIAILEYASELAGGRGWPAAAAARAEARAAAAEMHAGFAVLRNRYPMNVRARERRVAPSAALESEIARVDRLWSESRERYGAGGPWLYGDYSAADAMYLPVALRFQTYGSAGLQGSARVYLATALADPLLAPWLRLAESESAVIANEEVGC